MGEDFIQIVTLLKDWPYGLFTISVIVVPNIQMDSCKIKVIKFIWAKIQRQQYNANNNIPKTNLLSQSNSKLKLISFCLSIALDRLVWREWLSCH